MSGFYVSHLKSDRAKYFAAQLEKRLAHPTLDEDQSTFVWFPSRDRKDMREVLSAGYAVLRDHPEFFYYKAKMKAHFDGREVALQLRLFYTPEEIASIRKQIEAKIADILGGIPPTADLWEKERAIFEYLQMNTVYTDDGAPERYNLVGGLLQGKAVCEGISKSFAVLCHRIGIPCIVVFSETHMWNLVNVNGTICNVDATYTTNFPHDFCDYTYFNVSDSDLGAEEHRKEIDCVPGCFDDSKNYYRRKKLCFDSESELKKYVLEKLLARKNPIYVKLNRGNIVQAIRSMSLSIPHRITFTYNERAKTALITSN